MPSGPMDTGFISVDMLIIVFLLISLVFWLAGIKNAKLRETIVTMPPLIITVGFLGVMINLIYQLTGK